MFAPVWSHGGTVRISMSLDGSVIMPFVVMEAPDGELSVQQVVKHKRDISVAVRSPLGDLCPIAKRHRDRLDPLFALIDSVRNRESVPADWPVIGFYDAYWIERGFSAELLSWHSDDYAHIIRIAAETAALGIHAKSLQRCTESAISFFTEFGCDGELPYWLALAKLPADLDVSLHEARILAAGYWRLMA